MVTAKHIGESPILSLQQAMPDHIIILAKNVMEFAQAYQQQDSSTMNSALKGVVAGIIMAGISTVLTFLGF